MPFQPCLFDLSSDFNVTTDLGPANKERLKLMWLELNNSWLGYYHSRSPPDLLGVCNEPCAALKWKSVEGINATVEPTAACRVARRNGLAW